MEALIATETTHDLLLSNAGIEEVIAKRGLTARRQLDAARKTLALEIKRKFP